MSQGPFISFNPGGKDRAPKPVMHSRRDFLHAAGFVLAAAFLAECAPPLTLAERNVKLVADLKAILGVTSATTRDQLAVDSAKAMQDQSWGINTSFGTYKGANGVQISLATDDIGEMQDILLDNNNPEDIAAYTASVNLRYPAISTKEPEVADFQTKSETDKPVKTQVVIYGTPGTVGRLKPNIVARYEPFIEQMLGFMDTDKIVVHLNFLPSGSGVRYIDEGGLYVPQSDNFSAHAHFIPAGDTQIEPFKRLDLYLNFFLIHKGEIIFGQTHDESMRLTLPNEVDSLLGFHTHGYKTKKFPNESHSTFVGWLAALDPTFAAMVLGGAAYKDATKPEMAELDILAKIGSSSS